MPQYNQRTPCAECPFRPTSAPGWLGSYTPQEVIDVIRGDGDFLCHPKVDYEDPDWDDEEKLMEYEECAGSMIFARKMCKRSRDREKAAGQDRVNLDAEILYPAEKFIEHHTSIPTKPKRKRGRR